MLMTIWLFIIAVVLIIGGSYLHKTIPGVVRRTVAIVLAGVILLIIALGRLL